MAKVNGFEKRLAAVLEEDLRKAGIDAKVETEKVRATKLIRVMVIAEQFLHMRPSERQDFVWRIIQHHFQPEDELRISMVLTVTRSELQAA